MEEADKINRLVITLNRKDYTSNDILDLLDERGFESADFVLDPSLD